MLHQTQVSLKAPTRVSLHPSCNPVSGRYNLRHVGGSRGQLLLVRGEGRSGGFTTGFVVGGLVCGVLGFLYAPQPTKDELVAKLDDINAAVDELTAKVTAPKENVQT